MKRKSNLWRGLSSILILLFCFVYFLGNVLLSNAASVNSFFGITGEAGGQTDETTTFYASEYGELSAENLAKLLEDDMALCKAELEEGAVLLKNENAALPLTSSERAITLFGRASVDIVYRGSAGGPSLDPSREITLKTAFENAGFSVNETLWNAYKASTTTRDINTGAIGEESKDFYTSDIQASFDNYSDAAIVVLSRYGGESKDLKTVDADGVAQLSLHESEKDLLNMIHESGKFGKIIVLINSVYAMDLGWLDEYGVDACLWIGNPGFYGLPGVVSLLDGEANPSGKLSDTFAANSLSSAAMQNFGDITYTNADELDGWSKNLSVYAEGIYVGYKYYETRYEDCILGQGNANGTAGVFESTEGWNYAEEMAYPFGYGLSYTTFSQTLDSLDYAADTDTFTAVVTVTNTGSVAGKDVVELYMQSPYTDYDKEHLVEKSAVSLIAFDKTDVLEPGASETVTLTFDRYLAANYDTGANDGAGGYILDAGTYYFAVGNGAHEAVNNILATKGVTEGLVDHNGEAFAGDTACVKSYEQAEFDDQSYRTSAVTGVEVSNLFADADPNYYGQEVTYLTRQDWEGTFPETISFAANDAIKAGMAATKSYTSSAADSDISSVTYAAENGLTLYDLVGKEYDDPEWQTLVEELTMKDLATLAVTNFGSKSLASIGRPATSESEGPEGTRGTYQYGDGNIATGYAGLPVLAATWNQDLQLRLGQLFGENCLYCDIDLINGPGANLHRTPYGGRASEYFSEDAVLTYYSCANMVQGMNEKHVLANIKHFALNEQETARQGISVYANEQSIRELYLKAFEKSFADGNVLAVMTSYVRIGTTYNGANAALVEGLIRNEWGFIGYVNIDYITESDYSSATDCLMAGTNVVMGNDDRTTLIMKAAKSDVNILKALQESAHRVLYAYSQSQMANRLTKTAEVTDFTAPWETALSAAQVAVGVIAALSVVWYLVKTYGKKKTEVESHEG